MKNKIIIISLLLIVSFLFSNEDSDKNVSPSVSIRYDNITGGDGFTPGHTIGMFLDIDGEKYTGFDTTSDGKEFRILIGWKWSIIGVGTREYEFTDDEGVTTTETASLYSFGAKYRMNNNLFTSVEYVKSDGDDAADGIRLSVGVDF